MFDSDVNGSWPSKEAHKLQASRSSPSTPTPIRSVECPIAANDGYNIHGIELLTSSAADAVAEVTGAFRQGHAGRGETEEQPMASGKELLTRPALSPQLKRLSKAHPL